MLLVSTVVVLASCTVSDDGGSCPESPATVITGLGQSTLLAQSDTQLESGLVQFDIIQMTQFVQADRFMLAVVANAQFVASHNKVAESLLARIANFFVPEASALDCIAPEFVSQQPIADITITSDAAMSAAYPAGSNRASVFRIGKQSVSSPEFGVTTDSIIARVPNDRETITEYLSVLPQVPLLLAMTLDINDPIASQHVFTVTYTLDNGSLYTTQTDAVIITP